MEHKTRVMQGIKRLATILGLKEITKKKETIIDKTEFIDFHLEGKDIELTIDVVLFEDDPDRKPFEFNLHAHNNSGISIFFRHASYDLFSDMLIGLETSALTLQKLRLNNDLRTFFGEEPEFYMLEPSSPSQLILPIMDGFLAYDRGEYAENARVYRIRHPHQPGQNLYSYAILQPTPDGASWFICIRCATDFSGGGGAQLRIIEDFLSRRKKEIKVQNVTCSEEALREFCKNRWANPVSDGVPYELRELQSNLSEYVGTPLCDNIRFKVIDAAFAHAFEGTEAGSISAQRIIIPEIERLARNFLKCATRQPASTLHKAKIKLFQEKLISQETNDILGTIERNFVAHGRETNTPHSYLTFESLKGLLWLSREVFRYDIKKKYKCKNDILFERNQEGAAFCVDGKEITVTPRDFYKQNESIFPESQFGNLRQRGR